MNKYKNDSSHADVVQHLSSNNWIKGNTENSLILSKYH